MATTIWKTWLLSMLLAATVNAVPANAQEPTPNRVARLSQFDGGTQWSGPDGQWHAADPLWPYSTGARIRVAAGSRAELHSGPHALRLQGPAELSIDALDEDELRLTLQRGNLNLRVRDLAPNERIEINTQNLALLADRPGEFRIDTDPANAGTRVLVRAGLVALYGENGESSTLTAGQQAQFVDRNLRMVALEGAGPRDLLDQWAAERNRAEDQSPSAQYLSREVLGYQELDLHGDWASDSQYGTVWYPRTTIANWEPYRYGQWRWIAPWGWTWFDDARWGFAPFHYGRWTQIGPRWAWVPGPRAQRPSYAPALVGFAGTPAPRPPNFARHRTPGTDWFPLAPGQTWRPHPGTGPRLQERVDRNPPPPQPAPLRSTQRERPPGFSVQTPPRSFEPGRAEPNPRERWQRDQQWQQQQQQQQQQQYRQQSLERDRNEQQQRQERMRQEQFQRANRAQQQLADQQQRMQHQQEQQMQQLRQQQERQQRDQQDLQRRQIQEQRQLMQQRQQERAVREQRDASEQQQRRQMQLERSQDRPMPPRTAIPQERRQPPPGDPGRRPGVRD
jgi:hypothetical protein